MHSELQGEKVVDGDVIDDNHVDIDGDDNNYVERKVKELPGSTDRRTSRQDIAKIMLRAALDIIK